MAKDYHHQTFHIFTPEDYIKDFSRPALKAIYTGTQSGPHNMSESLFFHYYVSYFYCRFNVDSVTVVKYSFLLSCIVYGVL
jgi:hypothetical protein